MKNQRRHLTAVVAALFAAFPLSGALQAQGASTDEVRSYIDGVSGISLDALVDAAVRGSPVIEASRARVASAEGQRQQASSRPNPSVSTERREQMGGMDNQTSVTVEWPLDLFRREARVREAASGVDIAQFRREDAARTIAADVRTQAGLLLAAARQLEVIDAIASASERTYQLLNARVEAGGAPPLDRDLAFVEWQRVRALRHRQTAEAEGALARLKAAAGRNVGDPLLLRESLEELALANRGPSGEGERAPSAGTTAEVRADVKEADAMIASARSRLERARQDARVDVNVFGAYMRMSSGFPQSGTKAGGAVVPIQATFHNVAFGATVMLPLRNRNEGLIAAAAADQRAAERDRDARLLAARADIAAARVRDTEAAHAVAVYTTGGVRTIARRNLDVVRESFQLGRLSLFDVLSEQRRLLDIEMAYTEALAEAFNARTELRRALGVAP